MVDSRPQRKGLPSSIQSTCPPSAVRNMRRRSISGIPAAQSRAWSAEAICTISGWSAGRPLVDPVRGAARRHAVPPQRSPAGADRRRAPGAGLCGGNLPGRQRAGTQSCATAGRQRRFPFRVGIADVVPKSITYQLLAPALALPEPVRLVCREDRLDRLLGELAIHRLDMVLADRPMPPGMDVKGYSHPLGECGVAFFAAPDLAARLSGGFPACLDGAPLLLPGEDSALSSPLAALAGAQGIAATHRRRVRRQCVEKGLRQGRRRCLSGAGRHRLRMWKASTTWCAWGKPANCASAISPSRWNVG
jgi:hypothetical protein